MTEQIFVLLWNTGLTLLIVIVSWAAKQKERDIYNLKD